MSSVSTRKSSSTTKDRDRQAKSDVSRAKEPSPKKRKKANHEPHRSSQAPTALSTSEKKVTNVDMINLSDLDLVQNAFPTEEKPDDKRKHLATTDTKETRSLKGLEKECPNIDKDPRVVLHSIDNMVSPKRQFKATENDSRMCGVDNKAIDMFSMNDNGTEHDESPHPPVAENPGQTISTETTDNANKSHYIKCDSHLPEHSTRDPVLATEQNYEKEICTHNLEDSTPLNSQIYSYNKSENQTTSVVMQPSENTWSELELPPIWQDMVVDAPGYNQGNFDLNSYEPCQRDSFITLQPAAGQTLAQPCGNVQQVTAENWQLERCAELGNYQQRGTDVDGQMRLLEELHSPPRFTTLLGPPPHSPPVNQPCVSHDKFNSCCLDPQDQQNEQVDSGSFSTFDRVSRNPSASMATCTGYSVSNNEQIAGATENVGQANITATTYTCLDAQPASSQLPSLASGLGLAPYYSRPASAPNKNQAYPEAAIGDYRNWWMSHYYSGRYAVAPVNLQLACNHSPLVDSSQTYTDLTSPQSYTSIPSVHPGYPGYIGTPYAYLNQHQLQPAPTHHMQHDDQSEIQDELPVANDWQYDRANTSGGTHTGQVFRFPVSYNKDAESESSKITTDGGGGRKKVAEVVRKLREIVPGLKPRSSVTHVIKMTKAMMQFYYELHRSREITAYFEAAYTGQLPRLAMAATRLINVAEQPNSPLSHEKINVPQATSTPLSASEYEIAERQQTPCEINDRRSPCNRTLTVQPASSLLDDILGTCIQSSGINASTSHRPNQNREAKKVKLEPENGDENHQSYCSQVNPQQPHPLLMETSDCGNTPEFGRVNWSGTLSSSSSTTIGHKLSAGSSRCDTLSEYCLGADHASADRDSVEKMRADNGNNSYQADRCAPHSPDFFMAFSPQRWTEDQGK